MILTLNELSELGLQVEYQEPGPECLCGQVVVSGRYVSAAGVQSVVETYPLPFTEAGHSSASFLRMRLERSSYQAELRQVLLDHKQDFVRSGVTVILQETNFLYRSPSTKCTRAYSYTYRSVSMALKAAWSQRGLSRSEIRQRLSQIVSRDHE